MITLICVGKKSEYDDRILEYQKRLKKPYDLVIKTINYSDKVTESKQILELINKINNPFIILLDENGKNINNQELLILFSSNLDIGKEIVLIIGGAYGVDNNIKSLANYTLSLGKLVLPHQIVRLIIIEQIYRTYTLSINHPYHH